MLWCPGKERRWPGAEGGGQQAVQVGQLRGGPDLLLQGPADLPPGLPQGAGHHVLQQGCLQDETGL